MKRLGSLACVLGLATATFPTRVVSNAAVLELPAADVAVYESKGDSSALYRSERPSFPQIQPWVNPEDEETPSEWFDEFYGLEEVCREDYLRLCSMNVAPEPVNEGPGWFDRFYTASTHIAATRKLTSQIARHWAPEKLAEASKHHHHEHHRISHMHRHNQHHEHHAHHHDRHHDERHHEHHPIRHSEPAELSPVGNPLGYDMQVEMCMRDNFDNLSPECQAAINTYDTEEAEYVPELHPGLAWMSAIIWVCLAMFTCKRAKLAKKRRHEICTVLETVRDNPELKATVESAAGVEVPQLKRVKPCCFFIGPAIITFWGVMSTLHAICVTGAYVAEDDSEAAETMGWVLIALAAVVLLGLLFAFVRVMCRSPSVNAWRYSYNGSNDGYIALTGIQHQPATVPGHVYMGVPVTAPTAVAAGAQTYSSMNVV